MCGARRLTPIRTSLRISSPSEPAIVALAWLFSDMQCRQAAELIGYPIGENERNLFSKKLTGIFILIPRGGIGFRNHLSYSL